MTPETTSAVPHPDVLTAAGNIDLTSVSDLPPELEIENLRRRGIDILRIKWSTGTSEKKSWLQRIGIGRPANSTPPKFILTFADRQVTLATPASRISAGHDTVFRYDDVVSVEKVGGNGKSKFVININARARNLTLGAELTETGLNWLRDRILLEVAGLVWKPIFNVGKRTTRITSNPDTEPYRNWTNFDNRLVRIFVEEAAPQVRSLEVAVANADWATARQRAHWLKSSSAAIGAVQLSELCQRLEIDVDTRDYTRVEALMPHISAGYGKVTSAYLRSTYVDETAAADAALSKVATVDSEPIDAEPQASKPECQPAAVDQSLAGVAVLLVEDSRVNQEVALECLREAGCKVTVASDGREAVDVCVGTTFDVILMDCQMPGIDGFEATRMIREVESKAMRPKTPIVALTANALRDDRGACLAAGMNDYLSKPFVDAELLEAIERWRNGINRKEAGSASAQVDQDAVASAEVAAVTAATAEAAPREAELAMA